jgi:hypothetical protein
MGVWSDIKGLTGGVVQLLIGGVKLKNDGGNLAVRNSADNADAEVTVSKVNISGEVLPLNTDAAQSGADWTYVIQRPVTGMSAAVTLTLPVDNGTANQVINTDGNGVLSWASAGTTTDLMHVNDTTLAFGDSSPVAMFALPGNAIVEMVETIIDTVFNGTAPTMSVGIAGTTSKYTASTQTNLKGTAGDKYQVNPGVAATAGAESLIITYSADSSSDGSARILVHYVTPA